MLTNKAELNALLTKKIFGFNRDFDKFKTSKGNYVALEDLKRNLVYDEGENYPNIRADFDEIVSGMVAEAKTERDRIKAENKAERDSDKAKALTIHDIEEIIAKPDFRYTYNEEELRWYLKSNIDITDEIVDYEAEVCSDNTKEANVETALFTYIRNNGLNYSCYDVGTISLLLEERETNIKLQRRKAEIMATKFDPSCVEYLDEGLKRIYDYFDIKEAYDVFNAVMKHWMCNAKRSAFAGKGRVWHQWVNLFGAQGAGKSWFVEHFTNVFSTCRNSVKMLNEMIDTGANGEMWEDVIITCDELGLRNNDSDTRGLKAEEMKILKSILTSNEIYQRAYFTQHRGKLNNLASVMSTANEHLYEIMPDPTGMRRFVEFTCRCGRKEEKDWAELNTIDFLKMWKGIDANRQYFTVDSDVGRKLSKIQASYVAIPKTLSSWADERLAKWQTTFKDVKVGDIDCEYENYREYCKTSCGGKGASKRSLRELLDSFGYNTLLTFAKVGEDMAYEAKHLEDYIGEDGDPAFNKVLDPMDKQLHLQHYKMIVEESFKRENGTEAFNEL